MTPFLSPAYVVNFIKVNVTFYPSSPLAVYFVCGCSCKILFFLSLPFLHENVGFLVFWMALLKKALQLKQDAAANERGRKLNFTQIKK